VAKKQPRRASSRRQSDALPRRRRWRRVVMLLALLIVLVGVALALRFFGIGGSGPAAQALTDPNAPLASFYTPEVLRWREDILRWAQAYHINPNVIAILMQVESCGSAEVLSGAGAVGLMQVMPYHFENGDNMLNPDTNVALGLSIYYECLTQFANWDVGRAAACYNGGPGVLQRPFNQWPLETQLYYEWVTGLWQDVVSGAQTSATLERWLEAGGARLCAQAAQHVPRRTPDAATP